MTFTYSFATDSGLRRPSSNCDADWVDHRPSGLTNLKVRHPLRCSRTSTPASAASSDSGVPRVLH
eukprot:scaffold49548_cov62-Phaeocystis_antarctica.AAC.2